MKMKQSTELAMFGKKNVYVKNHRSRSCKYIILYIYIHIDFTWLWKMDEHGPFIDDLFCLFNI